MTEVDVNGSAGAGLDFAVTKAVLNSSSTTERLGHLHTLEERLGDNGEESSLRKKCP
jgi:hypothetical protein